MLFWVGIEAATSSTMDLRYDAAIDHPAINWATGFKRGEEIPPSRG
jgi:hypothetical protein